MVNRSRKRQNKDLNGIQIKENKMTIEWQQI